MAMQPGDSLTEAIQDEYKARATYRAVIKAFGEVRPFINVVEAEERHIRALLPLFDKYGVPVPRDEWPSRVKVPESVEKACQAGVRAEVDNAAMYRRLIESTRDFPDVQEVLTRLKRASAENHLPAFRRCVDRAGRGRNVARGNRSPGRGRLR